MKLAHAYDVLAAFKKIIDEDRGQRAKTIVESNPQLVPAMIAIQCRLGLIAPESTSNDASSSMSGASSQTNITHAASLSSIPSFMTSSTSFPQQIPVPPPPPQMPTAPFNPYQPQHQQRAIPPTAQGLPPAPGLGVVPAQQLAPPPPPPPPMNLHGSQHQDQLMQQVMQMTDADLNMLPPDQRNQMIALREGLYQKQRQQQQQQYQQGWPQSY